MKELDLDSTGVLSAGGSTAVGAMSADLKESTGTDILRSPNLLGLAWIDVPDSDLDPGYYGLRSSPNRHDLVAPVIVDIIRPRDGKVLVSVLPDNWVPSLSQGEGDPKFFGQAVPVDFDPNFTVGGPINLNRWKISLWIGGKKWLLCITIGRRAEALADGPGVIDIEEPRPRETETP